jgi:DNA-binding transcriptional LysR family regulator
VISRRLQYFIALAEELNFGRAAARLSISQSSLSQQIKALESDLNVRLFERDRHRVALTPAGLALLKDGSDLLAAADRALATARNAGSNGALEFGIATGLDLPAGLRDFHEAHPAVRLNICEDSRQAIQRGLALGSLDVGCFQGPTVFDEIDTAVVERRTIRAYLPGTRTNAEPLVLSRMPKERWLIQARDFGPALHDAIRQLISTAVTDPDIHEIRAASPHLLLSAVAAGLGIYVGAELPVIPAAGSITRRAIAGAPEAEVLIGWRRGRKGAHLAWFKARYKTDHRHSNNR